MKHFVTVATFTYPHEYIVLKSILADENVPFIFENETIISVSPFYSFALGGIKLKVHKAYADFVREIIKDLNEPDSHLKLV
ncbi:DUF2007 domain-containing protein [Zhouia spongiae]|uniref:DUF2007 domain-containing protein n=1 Tax=Zhouia spongiae TaxID=2202721 RepID=A0ABY3YPH3_9FLAO|nr:DUF2007 domain-containing protein [Zhouia spongiae]UNY99735.1 DUF2007 domain-containing protein [Zhouia spongiae]